jgi:hypothetical protein
MGVSQQFIGVNSSNYGGIHSVLLNPANTADSRYKVYFNLSGFDVTTLNSSMKWAAPFSLLALFTGTVPSKYNGPKGKPLWLPEYYSFNASRLLDLRLNTDYRGPAFQLSFPRKKFGIAGGVRLRLFNSFLDATPGLAAAVFTGTNNDLLKGYPFSGEKGLLNMGVYNEMYGSLGIVLKEDNRHFFKIGGTIKRVTSGTQLSVFADNLNYQIDDVSPFTTTQNITVHSATGSFFHASESEEGFGSSWLINQMTSFRNVGNGFGADIGIIYERRPYYATQKYRYKGDVIPDPEINKHEFRIGVSLVDIGYVRFSSPTAVQVGAINDATAFIPPATFYHINSTKMFVGDMEEVFPFDPSTYGNSFHILMPATLHLHGEYRIREGFYLSGSLRQFLFKRNRVGPVGYSGISFIPRFEKKHLEYSFPVSVDFNYRVVAIGGSLRVGPLWVGSDNLTGLLGIGKPRGAAIHAALFVGLDHKRPKNKLIVCP